MAQIIMGGRARGFRNFGEGAVMAGWKARLTLVFLLIALLAWRSMALAQPADAPTGEKLAYNVRDLTVQITSFHGQDIAAEGYGLVVAQRGDVVTIVTADHVVRDPDGAEYGQVRVAFYTDQAHPQTATVLDLRLPPAYGDLAALEVRKPGFRMTQPPIAQLPLTQGERAWRVGKQRGWTPGNIPGVFTGTERTIWLGFDNLDTPRGSSGGPIVVEKGLVGMVTDDHSGRALVLPINIIANFFREKGLPWGLVGSPEPSAAPQPKPTSEANVTSGFRVKEVFLHATPFDYKGDCPVKIIFAGHVSAGGGSGLVSYIIRISDRGSATIQTQGSESIHTLTFDGPGIKPVSSEWTLGGPGVKFSGWEAIEILDPNTLKSEQANFSIECTPSLPASVASVKISSATCSKIGDGAFRVEVSGDATAPLATFLAVSVDFRPNSKNMWNIGCGTWNDVRSGWYHYCQRSGNQASQTKWTMTAVLYDQQNQQPDVAVGTLLKGSPGQSNFPIPRLASDKSPNLVCR
jgi:hypothetical protein